MSDNNKAEVSVSEGELVQITFRVKDKTLCEQLINGWLNDGQDKEYGFETCSLATGNDVFTYEQRSEAIKKCKELQKLLSNESGDGLAAMLGMFGGMKSLPSNMDVATFDSMPFANDAHEEVKTDE